MKIKNELKKLGKITNQRFKTISREIGKTIIQLEQDKAIARSYGIYID